MTDDVKRELERAAEALARVSPTTTDERSTLEQASRQLEFVVELLGKRDVLTKNDVRLLRRILPTGTRVQLAMHQDKRSITGPDIDCAALLPLCKARCCSFKVLLAEEDVRDGRLRWKLDEPYVLEREPDGYCTHLEQGGGCNCYDARPATCRTYDCRKDQRVWLDYEARVPAPMPPWLSLSLVATEHDPDRRTPGG